MALSKPDELATWLKFWGQTEGRDKFSKCMQYGCRGLSWAVADQKDISGRLMKLSQTTGDSRKIFRLGKFLNEYLKMRDMIRAGPKSRMTLDQYLSFLARLSFFFYWIHDSLNILSKIKVVQVETKPIAKRASLFWFIGLILGILVELRNLRRITVEEGNLLLQLTSDKDSSTPPSDPAAAADLDRVAELRKKIKSCRAARRASYLGLLKNFGDLIPASNGIELPHRILGRGFNDGLLGIGGFTSAFISCYQQYPKK